MQLMLKMTKMSYALTVEQDILEKKGTATKTKTFDF